MSKNVMIDGKTYNGVSTVQLNTSTGGTATFKDTDEITNPSGTVNITENGTHDVANFAQAIVNVAASGGSSGSGTFVGDGTRNIELTLPPNSQILVVYHDTIANEDLSTLAPYSFLIGIWVKGAFFAYGGVNYNASNTGFSNIASWTKWGTDNSFPQYMNDDGSFKDTKLNISGGASKTLDGETYHWATF